MQRKHQDLKQSHQMVATANVRQLVSQHSSCLIATQLGKQPLRKQHHLLVPTTHDERTYRNFGDTQLWTSRQSHLSANLLGIFVELSVSWLALRDHPQQTQVPTQSNADEDKHS